MISAAVMAAALNAACAGNAGAVVQPLPYELPGLVLRCPSDEEHDRRMRAIERLHSEGLGSIPGIDVIE